MSSEKQNREAETKGQDNANPTIPYSQQTTGNSGSYPRFNYGTGSSYIPPVSDKKLSETTGLMNKDEEEPFIKCSIS